MEGMFGQFKEVTFQSVWEQVQSRKTVSFSVVRDTSQFLVINLAWITAGLLLWRGPAVTRAEETEQDEVDISRLNNFFTNPTVVARNLFVCTSLFLMTFLFWFLPSLLWKKSVAGSQSKEERLAELSQDLDTAQERVTGVYHSLVESGVEDLYNRLL